MMNRAIQPGQQLGGLGGNRVNNLEGWGGTKQLGGLGREETTWRVGEGRNNLEGWRGKKQLGGLERRGKKQIVFCSGYNAPSLFRNLLKMCLTCRVRGTLQT